MRPCLPYYGTSAVPEYDSLQVVLVVLVKGRPYCTVFMTYGSLLAARNSRLGPRDLANV